MVETRFTDHGTEVHKSPELAWKSAINPDILSVLLVKPEYMSAWNLYQYTRHLAENKQKTEQYDIAMWKKLIYPFTALVMMALMFSTAGVPPFIGFWAKLWIIQALLGGSHVWLATFAVLASVVGAFYYLRVVWYMYFDAADGRPVPETRPRMRLILVLNTAAVVFMGLMPNALLSVCQRVLP